MNKVAVIGAVGDSVFLSVKNFHAGGETIQAESFHYELGGKGFNQAIAANRFGAQTFFLGAIGKVNFDKVNNYLKKEGIDSCLIKKDGDSSFAVIITDSKGSNRVTVYNGVQLEINDLKHYINYIVDADVLLLNNEVPEEVNLEAARIAKANNTKVILNPAPYRKICDELTILIDFFTPNEHELIGLEEFQNVIVTLGEKGCMNCFDKEIIPVRKVRAIDTTGAGDTFNGVFAAMIANNKSIKEACLTANTAASIMVTRKYVIDSIPYKKEILHLI